MADNITLNAGSGGSSLRTDDDGSNHWQYVKLAFGADNTQNIVTSTGTNPLPVALSDVDNAVLDTMVTSLQLIDNIVLVEDAVHSSGDSGVMALAVRKDVLAALAGADGDYAPLQVNASGALYIQEGVALDVSGATVTVDLGSNNDVTIDGSSIVHAEDSAHSSGEDGVMSLVVRKDSAGTLVGADGDYSPLQVDSAGALRVTGGGGGTEYNEDDATPATIVGTATLIERDDALATVTPAEGDWIGLRGNERGALWVELDPANAVTVDNGGTFVVQEDGAALTALQLIDDIVVVLGTATYSEASTKGAVMGAVRNDALAALANTDNEFAPLQVNDLGALWVDPEPNRIDSGNSTTSTLTSASVFTGTGVDVLGWAAVTIQLDSSHDSATDGMQFQFSTDNSNWDSVHNFTYTAADGARVFQFSAHANYFRVVYTNGGTGQSHFRVQTILHHDTPGVSIHRLVDDIHSDRSSTIVKSVIFAQAGGSEDFKAIASTTGGNLKISIEEISDGLDIGAGNAGSETARVSISTDDVNLAAMNTSLALIDNAVSGAGFNITQFNGAAVPIGAGTEAAALRVTVATDSTGLLSIDDGGGSLTIDGTVTASNTAGNIAHDSADSGNPVKIGARAISADITALTANDRSDLLTDLVGKLLVQPYALKENFLSGTANATGTSDTSIIAAQGTGIKIYVTTLVVTNASGTDSEVIIKDGTTEIARISAPANGGAIANLVIPLKTTANAALQFASVDSVTTMYVTAVGYKGV